MAGREHIRAAERTHARRSSSRQSSSGTGASVALREKPDPGRVTPAQVLALQASAGNLAVQRLLAEGALSLQRDKAPGPATASPPTPAPPATTPAKRHDYIFIMGTDRRGSKNKFYTAAIKYFSTTAPGATMVKDRRSLAAVFEYLRDEVKDPIGNLYLVSHASQDGVLSFPLSDGDTDRKLTYPELRDAIKSHPELFKLSGQVDAGTTILIKGCNIGRSQRFIDVLDEAFGGLDTVIAPTHKQEYEWSGKSVSQSFTTYFVEEPGSVTLNRSDQEAAFQAKYPELPKKSWDALVKKAKRTVESIPFDEDTDLPPAKTAVAYANKQGGSTRVTKLIGIDEVDAGDNVDHVYHFKAAGGGTVDVTFHVVKDDAAIKNAKTKWNPDLARPGMYRWRVQWRSQLKDGLTFRVRVVGERTEYDIGEKVSDDQGKPLEPKTNDPTYFGTSTYTP
jgi:hypothetical protein